MSNQVAQNQPVRFGHYRILHEVGVGGLGKVFKALDERTGQTVAIKLLHERFTTSRKFLGIFHRELLTVSRLYNKHIVGYLDSHFEPPKCFIVTEFVDGWSLYALMKRVNRLPPLVALCIFMDMLQGIDYLHLHDTIHSDLSSPNVMLDKSGRVMVTDFGLSCQIDVEDYKNYMVGTPGYYSPEHVTSNAIVPQTDIYCAGLILHEMISGEKAVIASSDRKKVISSMKRVSVDLIRCKDRKLQSYLRKLVKGTLQYNTSKRTPSTEVLMYQTYKILKYFNIRYARHGIKKFLIDCGLTAGPFTGNDQDIYYGTER